MNTKNIITGLIIEQTNSMDLCRKYHIPQSLLEEMIEEGLLNSDSKPFEQMLFDNAEVLRVEAALRLHRDLKINLPGVVLAIELLKEMDELRRELDILRKHF